MIPLSTVTEQLLGGHDDLHVRAAAAETLSEWSDDRTAVRALLLGLWDDDATVRSICESTLRKVFEDGDFDTRVLVLERLLARIATDQNQHIDEPERLLSNIVTQARRDRHQHPALFSRLLVEIERTRGDGVYSKTVRQKLRKAYSIRADVSPDSARRISRFENERSLERLWDATTEPSEVEHAISSLGGTGLEETSLKTILSHLLPLSTYPVDEDSLHRSVVQNLESWTVSFPNDDLIDIAEGVEALKSHQRGDSAELPPALRNEYGFNAVGVDILVAQLQQFADDAGATSIVTSLVSLLAESGDLRPHVETLVDVAQKTENDIQRAMLNVLCSQLIAPPETASDNPLFEKEFEAARKANRHIQDFVVQTVSRRGVDEDIASELVEGLLRSHPNDLNTLIPELVESWDVNDQVMERVLTTIEDEALNETTELLVEQYEALDRSDTDTAVRLLDTLAVLGNEPAVRQLRNATHSTSDSISTRARHALVDDNLYESVRQIDTRQRALTVANRCQKIEGEVDSLTQSRREHRLELARTITRFDMTLFEANECLLEGQFDAVECYLDGFATLFEINEANLRLECVVEQAASTHTEVGHHATEMVTGSQFTDGLQTEVEAMGRQLGSLERLVGSISSNCEELESLLASLDMELSNRDDEIREIQRSALTELRARHQSARETWGNRLVSLRDRYDRLINRFETETFNRQSKIDSVDDAIREIESTRARIERLTETREAERNRIEEILRETADDLDNLDDDLQRTAGEARDLQTKIDEQTRQIDVLASERQVLTQRIDEDQTAYEEIRPRADEEQRRNYEQASERARFHSRRRVFDDYLRRRYESKLSKAYDTGTRQYTVVESIRSELETRS